MLNCIEDNEAYVVGVVCGYLSYSHDVYGERFYRFMLRSDRLSQNSDLICVTISEKMLTDISIDIGMHLAVFGQFRSYNYHTENKNRLLLSVFAREVTLSDEEPASLKPNSIFLDGYVCKKPVYRKTPLGREIADVLLAVNRPYGKSDYIPCICWGRNARFADSFSVGGHVQLWGRIQSREYQKKLSDTETEQRIAYEVSVSKLDYLEDIASGQ